MTTLLGLLVAESWFSRDLREGEPGRALGYILASVLGGITAAALGCALGRKLA